jgi:LCP family protein required for cell wall assembly
MNMRTARRDGRQERTSTAARPQPRRRAGVALFASALVLLAAVSAYLVAVIAVRLDRLFLPGNEIALPQAFRAVPGLAEAVPPLGEGTVATIGDRINVLVLGLDRRPSEGQEPTRTDTMAVLTLDPMSRTAGVLSIPRDLLVEIPNGRGGYFVDRINTAYRFGGLTDYEGGALQAVRDTIEHNFPQIRVDYEVVIDFAAFIRIIDTLGGVDVYIPEGFRYTERVSVDDRDGVLPVFQAGWEHMNGERALYYVRYREGPDGDLGRIRRQQDVMFAVAQKLVGLGAVARAPELWRQYSEAVVTDIPSYRIPGLALLAGQIGLERVVMRSLGEVARDAVTAGGADVLVAEPEDIARVVNALFYDPRLRQEGAQIEIRNATARAGLGTAAAGYFVQHGLVAEALTVAAAPATVQDETVILNYRGKDYTAERLAEWLGVPAARVRRAPDARSAAGPDIVVVLGRDARVPTPTRARAFAP